MAGRPQDPGTTAAGSSARASGKSCIQPPQTSGLPSQAPSTLFSVLKCPQLIHLLHIPQLTHLEAALLISELPRGPETNLVPLSSLSRATRPTALGVVELPLPLVRDHVANAFWASLTRYL